MSDTAYSQPEQSPQMGQPPVPPAKGSNGLATAGFVLGLLGFLGSWIPVVNVVGIILGVLGAILAAVGLAKSKRVRAGKGLAIAGVVLGGLALVIGVVVNVAFVNAVDDAVDDATDTSVQTPVDSSSKDADNAEQADKKLGTSRSNPAPLGSSVTGGNWTVKINSVKTAKQDSLGAAPAAGHTLLVVNLTAVYNGDDPQGETPFASVHFVGDDGKAIGTTDGSTLFIDDDSFDSLTTVYAGGKVRGNQIIEVPAQGWQNGVLAVSPDMLSDDTFIALK